MTRNGKNKKTGAAAGEQLTPKQRHDNWRQSKIERAAQDGYNVISQETKDVALLINLTNSHDNIIKYLRLNAGINPKITIEKLQEVLTKSRQAMETLNEVNAIAYQLAGRDYRPPRGMNNPLKKKPVQTAPAPKKEEAKQKAVKEATPRVAPQPEAAPAADAPVTEASAA